MSDDNRNGRDNGVTISNKNLLEGLTMLFCNVKEKFLFGCRPLLRCSFLSLWFGDSATLIGIAGACVLS